MKKISFATIIAVIAALLAVSATFALVNNGSFETGDFTGWVKSAFINNGFSSTHGSGGSDLSIIVGGPAVAPLSFSDAHTNGVVKYPAYGHYSARVNSEASYTGGGFEKNANSISQNITAVLDPGDGLAHIRFTYSAVMVNPLDNPHTDEEKPYFRVKAINTSNGNDVLYDFSSYVGEPGKNWQNGPVFSGTDTWKYLDWSYIDLVSSAAHPVNAGDVITLEITAAGCSLGGHPGYVYVDEVTDGDISGPSINATGPSTIAPGATITYTYNYSNGSGSPISSIITATEPAGVTFTSVSDVANCSLSSGTVTCEYPTLASGGSGSFTISGTVTALGGSQIAHGNYKIAATGFPVVGGQTVLTNVSGTPEIEVWDAATNLTDGSATVDFGNYLACNLAQKTFTVKNIGTTDLTLSTPTLPTGYTLVTNFGSTTLAPSAETTFKVRLTDSAQPGTVSGSVSFANNDTDENPFNFTISTTITSPTLASMQVLAGSSVTPIDAISVLPNSSTRKFYVQNTGPVKITSNTCEISSMLVKYSNVSYSELMGFPANQLTTDYWFPYYNNIAMDSQLRVTNVGDVPTTITVTYGNNIPLDSYTLAAGSATRKNYIGINSGPLHVTSSASNILTSIRVIYGSLSFSELMGLPANRLTTDYWYPYYNNTAMDSQLRVSNVGGAPTTITVTYGDNIPLDSYTLAAGDSTRKNYIGINNGPLHVVSSGSSIITSVRVIYANKSFTELAGYPANQLTKEYTYPVYDNVAAESQLRISNVGGAPTTITVFGASNVVIDTYTLAAGTATRKTYPVNDGPLHVVSSASNILSTQRLLFTTSTFVSFNELQGFPTNQLTTEFLFPYYNNIAMNSELRIALPLYLP